jgi:CRP/FNR family transcriptional regulator, anaerobic regulatory protein
MIPIKSESAWRGTADCLKCGIRKLGLFADMKEEDFTAVRANIDALAYSSGDVIYTEGSPAQGIYCVNSGVVKLVRNTCDGRQRIVRVLRAGDVIGLEALVTRRYDSEAMALGAVMVCRIPLGMVEAALKHSNRLNAPLMSKWHQTLKDADDWLVDLNFGAARQRVSNLILKMRDPADACTSLLFSRGDMGAMLDLKLETVSREVSRLVKEGAIEALDRQGRIYRIVKLDVLTAA